VVKLKGEVKENWFTDELDRINRDHPVVRTIYAVAEITPARSERQGDGHGGSEWAHIAAKLVVVSPEFNDKKDANKWWEAHEPDEGKTLKVVHKTARQYLHWSGWL
jgi:hypothetical protein